MFLYYALNFSCLNSDFVIFSFKAEGKGQPHGVLQIFFIEFKAISNASDGGVRKAICLRQGG